MIKNKLITFVLILGLSACAKSSSVSSKTESSLEPSITVEPSTDTSSETKDYGTSYDQFDYLPGEFDVVATTKTDEYNNQELYGGYYSSLSTWDNGRDLKQKIYNIIYNEETFVPGTYEGNWDTNRSADESLTNFDNVRVLYNNNEELKTSTYSSTNTLGWSREHAFCASLLTGQITAEAVKTKGIATDFHNLFAANSGGNSSRSDKNLGEVSEAEDLENLAISKRREGYNYKASTQLFEPGNMDKGTLSRAILYMNTMYGKDSWNNNKYKVGDGVYIREALASKDNSDHAIGNSHILVNWANTYLVDRSEYQHNNFVESQQHNRNPFVDFVNLADYMYGNKRNSKGSIDMLISSYAYLNIDKDEVSNIAVKNVETKYYVGQSLDLSSAEVYLVKNNYERTLINDYVVYLDNTLLTADKTFTSDELGTHTVKLVSNEKEVSFKINVLAAGLVSCNNVHMFDSYIKDKTDTTSKDEVKAKTFKINDETFNISFNDCSPTESDLISAIANDSTYGVKIGSTAKYCGSMVIESSNIINNIDMVYLKGATAASTNETVMLQIIGEDNQVLASKVETINRENVEVGAMFDEPISGKIRITFTNANHKAIYLTGIAFNAIN